MSKESLTDQYVEYIGSVLQRMFSVADWYEHTQGEPISDDDLEEVLGESEEQVNRMVLKAMKGSNDQ